MKNSEKLKLLKPDSVTSDKFHVGIELELFNNDHGSSCGDACVENQREYLEGESTVGILQNYMGLSVNDARNISQYFNVSEWMDDYMSDWSCDGDCGNAGIDRSDIQYDLRKLTGNQSFKVVGDSSINCNDGADAEVCWNYFSSKENIKMNETILAYLKNSKEMEFNTSCGLHINLNNYLKVPNVRIPTDKLDMLFNLVAPSRRKSTYCNTQGMSDDKYSIIFNQDDRLEFRFFSPTLDAEKLNNYVSLAHVIYCRLAGKNKKLSKKLEKYFLDKMVFTNGISQKIAEDTIAFVNTLKSAEEFKAIREEELDTIDGQLADDVEYEEVSANV